ncbi:MAG: metallophosphoesterase family protein [Bacteroidetes bacterium]|nr:metallophosphoesterase family protein [Bacteroidota bacterium]
MKDTNARRRFLKQLTGTGAAAVAAELLPVTAGWEDRHVFLTQPYLQDPTPNGIVVRWITGLPSYSWVEWGESPALGQRTHSITNGLVDAYNRVNRIALAGLKPGATYYYRVCSKAITEFKPYQLTYGDTIRSDVFSFRTVAEHPDSVSWLILNDIHDRPQSIPHLLNMRGPEPYDFVFFNGDVFDFQENEQQIVDHMLRPCTDVFASETPFVYVRGNHETRGCFRSQWQDYFSNPGGREYFSFVRGPVHFTVIDTGEDKPDDTPVYAGIVDFDAYRREQAVWAEEVMQSQAYRSAAFRVVLMHIPNYYSGEWHGTVHCRQLFDPLFNKYGVDIAISGHTHQYGVHPPVEGRHRYPIIIGGGPQDGKRTLIKVGADRQRLELTMLDDSGKKVGEYELRSRGRGK